MSDWSSDVCSSDLYAKPPYNRDVGIPAEYDWRSLKAKRGAALEAHYIELLRALGTRKGMLGQIFTKAQNKIQDPAKLYRLIDMEIGRRSCRDRVCQYV